MSLDQNNLNKPNPRHDAKEQAILDFHGELEGLGHDIEQKPLASGLNTLPPSALKAIQKQALNETKITESKAAFTQLFDQLKTKQLSNQDYLDRVLKLATQDKAAVPEAYVERYLKFQKLLSPNFVTNRNDQNLIATSFTQLDLSANPNPITFIQSEIINNGSISDETKANVIEAFDLSPLEVNSGTDIAKGLTEQVVNLETGEQEYRFNENRKLEFRKGLKAFNESKTGHKMITAELADGRKRSFDVTGLPASTITEIGDMLMRWRIMEEAGISNFIEQVFYVDMSLIDHFDFQEARQNRQMTEALMGFNSGYDGRIMSEGDGKFMVWMLQAFSPKGDAAQGDYDIETTNQNLIELGIKDNSGKINFEMLKSASSYLRGIYLSGEPSFEDLKEHLNQSAY